MQELENAVSMPANLLNEMRYWPELLAQEAQTTLDFYIDLKSPHAYLAVRPTLELIRDFSVRLNVLPYTLSYEGLGITTRVEPDRRRRPASPAADRKARMYYATAREYARLQGLPLRSPYRLLDSELGHRCLLFAQRQDLALHFAMLVYLKGWSSGWRNFELESLVHLSEALIEAGVDTQELGHFLEHHADPELQQIMQQADSSGAVGVPHYVLTDPQTQRPLGLCGREHWALLRGKLLAAGLARHSDVRADFSHAWTGPASSATK